MKSIQHDYPASTGYNGFAWYYDQYWGDEYYAQAFGILEQLLLNELPSGARILDVGCGTGHLSKRLFDRGYLVTGIDISEDMLEYARLKLPQAEFQKADACDFYYPPIFDAAVSGFESISHIMDYDGLMAAFVNTYAALVPGGVFVFDITTRETYERLWHKSSIIVNEDHLVSIRGSYERISGTGRTLITLLELNDNWERKDITLSQKAYAIEDVAQGLRESGFADVRHYDAIRDLNMSGDLGIGRVFFRAVKKTVTSDG